MDVNSSFIRDSVKRICRIKTKLLKDMPFYGIFLGYFKFSLDDTIDTIYTDGERIFLNPEFLAIIDDTSLQFILLHETLHMALNHYVRRNEFIPEIFDIASDIVVNSNIYESFSRDERMISISIPSKYQEDIIGVAPHQLPDGTEGNLFTVDQVYSVLKKEMDEEMDHEFDDYSDSLFDDDFDSYSDQDGDVDDGCSSYEDDYGESGYDDSSFDGNESSEDDYDSEEYDDEEIDESEEDEEYNSSDSPSSKKKNRKKTKSRKNSDDYDDEEDESEEDEDDNSSDSSSSKKSNRKKKESRKNSDDDEDYEEEEEESEENEEDNSSDSSSSKKNSRKKTKSRKNSEYEEDFDDEEDESEGNEEENSSDSPSSKKKNRKKTKSRKNSDDEEDESEEDEKENSSDSSSSKKSNRKKKRARNDSKDDEDNDLSKDESKKNNSDERESSGESSIPSTNSKSKGKGNTKKGTHGGMKGRNPSLQGMGGGGKKSFAKGGNRSMQGMGSGGKNSFAKGRGLPKKHTEEKSAKNPSSRSFYKAKSHTKRTMDARKKRFDSHKEWGKEEDISKKLKKEYEWKENCMRIFRNLGNNNRGGMPLGALLNIEIEEKEMRLDWRTLLHDFLKLDEKDYSFTPPDKRYDSSPFFLPDFNLEELKIKNILVYVDTSGSMSHEEVKEILDEIRAAVSDSSCGLKGWLGTFDAGVSKPVPIEDESSFEDFKVLGGGGTSFTAVFEYIRDVFKPELDPESEEIAAIVMITDGIDSYPDEKITEGIPVLWIMTTDNEAPWGKTVHFFDDNGGEYEWL